MDTAKPKKSVSPPHQPESEQYFVSGAYAFLLRVSSVFGVAPLRFKSQGNGYVVSLSIPMCIYSYTLMTIIAVSSFINALAGLRSVHFSTHLSRVVTFSTRMLLTITASIAVYEAPSRMKKVLKLMNTIATVDKSICAQYSHEKEYKLWPALILFSCIFFVKALDEFCEAAVKAIVDNKEWKEAVPILLFYLIWFPVMIQDVQFAFISMSVYLRFKAINNVLDYAAQHVSDPFVQKVMNLDTLNILAIQVAPANAEAEPKEGVIVRKSANGEPRLIVPLPDAVHRIASLRCFLCEVVHQFNNYYNISLIFILLSIMIHLIVTPFYSFCEFVVYDRVSDIRASLIAIQCLIWGFVNLLRIIALVEPCHYTAAEGQRTETIVRRMLTVCPTKGELAARLDLFSRELMLHPVCYKTMSFCTLNRNLLITMLATAISYLVILLQFLKDESQN